MRTKFVLSLLVTFINIAVDSKAQVINVQDSLALVELYNNTNGSNWRHSDNWLIGPVSSWWGVGTAGDRVTYLNLNYNRLNGNIPSTLANLTELTYLSLSANHLNGAIPANIGNFTKLTYLNLGSNFLKGVLPSSVENLTLLTYLNLYANSNLNGALPPGIGKLTELETFDLGSNFFSGSLPSAIINLTKLKYLNFQKNKFSGSIPDSIGKLENVSYLDLSINSFDGIIPASIGNMQQLTYLSLSANLLSGNIPSEIGKLNKLTNAYFSGNQLTGKIPATIGDLSSIIYMGLDGNQLSGSIPTEVGNLVNLYYLGLNNNQFSGSTPQSFSNLQGLVNLYLDHNLLTNVSSVSKMNGLSVLRLNDNKLSGNFPQEFTKLKSLAQLDISGNKLSGFFPDNISNMKGLAAFDITRNQYNFDGMEQIYPIFSFVHYTNQAPVSIKQISKALSVSAGGTVDYNIYQWYKAGQTNAITTIYGDSLFYPSETGRYYVAITNVVALGVTLYTDTIEFDLTLPVSIIKFAAQSYGTIVDISWTSINEINVETYEVQSASNAFDFTTIGSLPAKGNSTQQTNYSFNDLQPLHGNNYYRLKAIDKDGKIAYSKTVLVSINDKTITLVYPVPAKNILHVQASSNASFSLINRAGKILLSKNINGNGTIDVSGLAAGIYYLKNNSNGEIKKIVVVRQ